ncbi:MAG: hypothetical protein RIS54_949 [Verrucomicrobiota bacterium]|jgi:hypothetical protein
MTSPRHPTLEALRRLLAAGSAALVLALGLMSVSPALHQWVHAVPCAEDADHDASAQSDQPFATDHGCAVIAFAHGLTVAGADVTADRTPETTVTAPLTARDEVRLATADRLLPRGRAPPAV